MSRNVSSRVVRFVPGQAVAVVGERFVALVDTDPRSDLVKELLRRTDSEDDPAEMIVTLASRGLRELPSFAVVTSERDSCRVLVRGDIVVVLCLDDGREDMAFGGAGVTSWVEYHQKNVGSVSVHLAGDLSEVGTFEITGGLVPANRLSWELSAGNSSSSASASEPLGGSADVAAAFQTEIGAGVAPELASGAGPEGISNAPPETNLAAEPAVETMAAHENQTIPFVADPVDQRPQEHASEVAPTPETVGHSRATGPIADVADESEEEDDYDHLFGATQYRPVSAAGIHVSDDVSVPPTAAGLSPSRDAAGLIAGVPGGSEPDTASQSNDAAPGDHDGMTMSIAQLRALHGGESPPGRDTPQGPSAHAPSVIATMVHAIECNAGHFNPPSATVCRVCGVEIPSRAHVTVPRPQLGTFRFSDGRDLAVSRPMLLGRSPKLDGPVSGEIPELVVLDSPAKEISGTHLEVRIEGWQVLVVDRQSTNGSTVRLPQREPRRLHPGEAFPIVPGSVVDMAGEVSFRFEVVS